MSLDNFWKIVNDIKTLKVQGAESVAKAALEATEIVFEHYKEKDPKTILLHLHSAKKILEKTRETEPLMRNVLNYITNIDIDECNIHTEFKLRIAYVHRHFHDVRERIANFGAKMIKDGMIIFTHCHSSTVMRILKKAKDEGKHFEVHNTETRPLFQGRITAKELNDYGIKVVHYVDSAARIALKDADLFLFGADAITATGKVINKIGTEMFAEIARLYDVAIFSAADSWKFDPLTYFQPEKIEIRCSEEIWPNAPKGVTIMNYAFEQVNPELIDGIITEFGILKPKELNKKIKEYYPWIFGIEKRRKK